jgi:hypothetical protein
LRHGKARGLKAEEIAKLQKAFDAAKSAASKAHLDQQKQRQRQRVGADSPFSRQSQDPRLFAEVVDYSADRDDGMESPSEEQLTARILAAVTALEQAQSDGASHAQMQKLAEALKLLRDQLPNPSVCVSASVK